VANRTSGPNSGNAVEHRAHGMCVVAIANKVQVERAFRRQPGQHMRTLLITFVVLIAFMSNGRAQDAASLTARWFVAAQQPSGLFNFDWISLPGKGRELLHGQGAHGLYRPASRGRIRTGKYYDRTRDPALRAPLAAALAALGKHSISIDRPWPQRAVEWTGILSLPYCVLRWRVCWTQPLALSTRRPGPAARLPTGTRHRLDRRYRRRPRAELYYARASGDQSLAPLRAGWLEGLRMRRVPGVDSGIS